MSRRRKTTTFPPHRKRGGRRTTETQPISPAQPTRERPVQDRPVPAKGRV